MSYSNYLYDLFRIFTFVVLTAHFAGTASEHFFYTLYLIGGDVITTMREIVFPSLIFIKDEFGGSRNVHISY